jgi:hypothetical protein
VVGGGWWAAGCWRDFPDESTDVEGDAARHANILHDSASAVRLQGPALTTSGEEPGALYAEQRLAVIRYPFKSTVNNPPHIVIIAGYPRRRADAANHRKGDSSSLLIGMARDGLATVTPHSTLALI